MQNATKTPPHDPIEKLTETAKPNGHKPQGSPSNGHKPHPPKPNGSAPNGAELINSSGILYQSADGAPRRSWRTWLIGRHLATADAAEQTIGKAIGLAVFASDALSSTAYATQEILAILAAAGSAAFGYAFPIAIAIIALLAIVTVSYEQTIHAYPRGGGAYIVARDYLGELTGQIGRAA